MFCWQRPEHDQRASAACIIDNNNDSAGAGQHDGAQVDV
jgi:hypothetical protein